MAYGIKFLCEQLDNSLGGWVRTNEFKFPTVGKFISQIRCSTLRKAQAFGLVKIYRASRKTRWVRVTKSGIRYLKLVNLISEEEASDYLRKMKLFDELFGNITPEQLEKEQILSRIRELKEKKGRAPTISDDPLLARQAIRFFGSWKKAKEMAIAGITVSNGSETAPQLPH